jgi:hypothetical protein
MATLAVTALAGQNPDIRIYLDFDPPNTVRRIDPEPNTVFDVYIVTDCFGPGGGLRVIAVAFERTFGAYRMGEYNLLGGLCQGHVDDPYYGWAAAAGAECVYPDSNGIVIVGYVRYYYTGPPGYIRIFPPELFGRDAVDCNFVDDDYWCIAGNAGVGVDPPPPEPGCECEPYSPTRDRSWSTVKALYR